MALSYRVLYRNCHLINNLTKPIRWSVHTNFSSRILSNGVCYRNEFVLKPGFVSKHNTTLPVYFKHYSNLNRDDSKPPDESEKKPGLIQRFKQMYRDYWYVLLPVHMTTSAIWFGSAYYLVRSGVDVLSILEFFGISETLISPLRDSSAGYFAFALALYKLVTPFRYAVTVGVTTYAIRRLTAIGWIKPVPSRERIKEMLQEKKDNFQDRIKESKELYQSQMKEKRSQVMDEMKRYKTDIRNLKNKVKKM